MTKQDIIKILMRRDHMTLDEAWDLVNETQDEINYLVESGDVDIFAAEDIIKYNLGLEPDYLDAFLVW